MTHSFTFEPRASEVLREIVTATVSIRNGRYAAYADPVAAIEEALKAASEAGVAELPEWNAADFGYVTDRNGALIEPRVPVGVTRELVIVSAIEKVLMRHEGA